MKEKFDNLQLKQLEAVINEEINKEEEKDATINSLGNDLIGQTVKRSHTDNES